MLMVLDSRVGFEGELVRTRIAEGRSRAKPKERPWADPLPSTVATERGQQAARAGRDAARIGEELQRRDIDYSAGDQSRILTANHERARNDLQRKKGQDRILLTS